MLEFEQNLLILRSMIDNLSILSTSEEVDETAFGSALFGIAETMDYHVKEMKKSFEEWCKNGNS